jgi:hypothetical protein
MAANFIIPYIFLHSEEKFLPVTPTQYLKEVVMMKGNNIIENEVSLDILSKHTYDNSLMLKSKHSNPKNFWNEYKYSNPNSIPLYYIENKKSLVYPDGKSRDYIERIFTTFYGYNEAGIFGLGNHEGDTEDFIIHYDLNGNPLRIYASCHADADGEWRAMKDVETINGHPILYSSKGDHGLYFEAKVYMRLFGVANDETQRGLLWVPQSAINITLTTWPEFAGGWGPTGVSGPMRNFGPEIYWKSNTPLQRFLMIKSFVEFNPYV